MSLTAQEIDRISELTAQRVLALLGALPKAEPSAPAPVLLHSLSLRDFAVCVGLHYETVRAECANRHSRRIPREFVKGPPYRINAAKVLPLWGVTPELAMARLREHRPAPPQPQTPSPALQPSQA
jgi:hypothetical protein